MKSERKPNILLIFTDQHRLSAVGCYGDTPCQTPNIDRLAREGVRFETAYTVCPVCSPARATIMTGLYPHAHGICSNVHNLGSSVHELADRPELLSRRLQTAGYQCGYSGKWHLGTAQKRSFHAENMPSLPKDVGFRGQNFPGHGGGGFNYPEYKEYLSQNSFTHEVYQIKEAPIKVMPYGVLSGSVESTVPYFLADNTIKMMDDFRESGDPFFIWHNFWGPHGPYYSPMEFYDLYADVEIPEWPNYKWDAKSINAPHQVKLHPHAEQLTWEDWAEGIKHYYAFTTLIVKQIGRIINHLEQSGLMENTIVIFTADHGETLGSHGGLTDKGWHHFEEIQRIPFIVRTPGEEKKGTVLQEWVSIADVYPTILDMAGVDVDESVIHGRSFMPILEGQSSDWRDTIFVEFNGVNSLATSMMSVRKGGFKYGWNCSNLDELYDLKNDPYEMNNLISDPAYSDKVREMRTLIADWMAETRYPGLGMYRQSRMGQYGA